MPVNSPADVALVVLLIALVPVGVAAVVSPALLVRHLGGPRNRRVPAREMFLRLAGTLVLIGVLVLGYRWWRT